LTTYFVIDRKVDKTD